MLRIISKIIALYVVSFVAVSLCLKNTTISWCSSYTSFSCKVTSPVSFVSKNFCSPTSVGSELTML